LQEHYHKAVLHKLRNMNTFRILFHFESEQYSVVEIKLFLPDETDKSKLYFWFLYDKQEAILQKLRFVSMSSEGDSELRVFEHERITFNTQKAELVSLNKKFVLDVIPTDVDLSIELQEKIMKLE
jgi:hypothetical protein